ncbi:restriction endonuclease subunit S [Campylobacter sp. CCUG 57310]|uniref:restriction endonuclease subunit S n=1 Tax=Campylobacter sp. CCUG 57310 TaxID=2517362 RepID=UPI0015668BBD|nr:restriction endonuclease subunit S [Campylobacter sp. CCUG 57310]QKF91588.1 type IIB restriction/modification system, specificity subunit [Campylobacter sp. CCUG 57310]
MASWNIVNYNYVISKDRMDSDFFQKKDISLERAILNFNNKKLKELTFEIKERFNKKDWNEPIQYNDIGNTDIMYGEIKDNIINGYDAPNRATFINKKDDLLISTVRPNRNANSIIEDREMLQVGSNGFCNLRAKNNIDPNYLFAYTKTKHFIQMLMRASKSSMYPSVSNYDIINTPIFIASKKSLDEIINNIKRARELRIESKKLYLEAKRMLEQHLGLNSLTLSNENKYICNLEELIFANRTDAEYYKTSYKQIINHINHLNPVKLSHICNFYKGYEVGSDSYIPEGCIFIRVSNVTQEGLAFSESDKYIRDDTYKQLMRYKPNKGDILLTKDGSICVCCVLDDEINGVISSGVIRMTLKNTDIPKEYLVLVINSIIGKMQANRDCGGAIITHWKLDYIKQILIPTLDKKIMSDIHNIIIKSKQTRDESKRLIDLSKNKIEKMIDDIL